MSNYVKLGIAALLPVLAAVILHFLDTKTAFGKLNKTVKQIVFGVVFGVLAVVGTEWGIPINGAQMNCRDAAVLVGGLMFGAPAGIIAGLIGGIERWIAVAWGVGTFTRVACSVSTIIAGFYSAALRKYMFENKRPGWLISLAIGVVMEVLHLTMVFITNMATPEKAMDVVRVCTAPMVSANGLSVMFAALFLAIICREKVRLIDRRKGIRISQTVQRWLLITVLLAFVITTLFVSALQSELANTQADSLLNLAIEDTAADLEDTTDNNAISVAYQVEADLREDDINTVAERYGVAEINVVNTLGIIKESTAPDFVGFDFHSGEQSAEFLCLLGNSWEYAQKYGPISYDESIYRKYAGVKGNIGFVQIGYDAEQFQANIANQMSTITKNRHVGETGFMLVIDNKGQVVSAPKGMLAERLGDEAEIILANQPQTSFRMAINSVECYCRYDTAEGYYLVSALPMDEALKIRNIALYVNTFMEVLVFAILFALVCLLIRKIVVERIQKVNASLAKITGGNLDEVVNVRTNAEFISLSDDINSTVDTLKRYIAEAAARIDKELEFAKNIQASALPSKFPAFPDHVKEFDIYATMDPAKEVGGDFYDFYMTNDHTLHFLIADVSGKGIPAAMFMMRAKTELKSLTEANVPLNDVFTNGNHALCEGNDAGMFVTAWQGNLDLNSGAVRFVNGGHNPPLVRHQDGKFEYLRTRAGLVLAGMDGVKYKLQDMNFGPGDTLFLYTDGVTEATNANNELYGEERLLNALNSREFATMEELCRYVKTDVDAFVAEAPQFDDITMVALRYFGAVQVPTYHSEEAKIADIPELTDFVDAELEKMDCPMKSQIQINIAIDEIYSNIVKYGYPKNPGPATVKVIEKFNPHRVYIRFSDSGIPYNPLTYKEPDTTLSAEERQIGGLGIFMVKKSMDTMKYKYENDENILTIKKILE